MFQSIGRATIRMGKEYNRRNRRGYSLCSKAGQAYDIQNEDMMRRQGRR